MKKPVKILLIVLGAVGIIVGAWLLYNALSGKVDTASGEQKEYKDAPAFTVYTKDREAVNLADLKGKPVVLNFWASWCSPCASEMPHFQKAYEKYGNEVEFMMIDLCGYGNDSKANALRMIEDSSYTFPVYFDESGEAMSRYISQSIPVSCFINEEGKLEALLIGMMNEKALEQYITQIMN